jgi:hypothetical protein
MMRMCVQVAKCYSVTVSGFVVLTATTLRLYDELLQSCRHEADWHVT